MPPEHGDAWKTLPGPGRRVVILRVHLLLGMAAALRFRMTMRLTSLASRQSVQMTAKTFTKLLYMARLQGWKPERLPEDWPTSSWNTEVILRETDPYRQGLVSKIDARGLGDALQRLAELEGIAADPEIHAAIMQFRTVLSASAFLATEQSTGDTVMFTR